MLRAGNIVTRLTDASVVVNEGIEAFAFLRLGARTEAAKERRHPQPSPGVVARLPVEGNTIDGVVST